MEESVSVRLFDRLRDGYTPTDAGRSVIAAAERMEEETVTADRIITGGDLRLTGTIRVTAPELFASCFLARHLSEFRAAHPSLEVEIIADDRRVSLAERDADLAVRVTRPSEPTLFGRMIATMCWGLYAGEALATQLKGNGGAARLEDALFVGWEGSVPAQTVSAWLDQRWPDARYLCRTTSLIANAAAAARGPAVVPLPCILGAQTPGLVALEKPLGALAVEIWILTHQDLRGNARVRALMDHLALAAVHDQALFSGQDDG
jgi:DNA-binding transcriptional LysR family regulator